ncbi:MAG: alpha/beta hydrolase family protein [Promethearchaeota archaeon]
MNRVKKRLIGIILVIFVIVGVGGGIAAYNLLGPVTTRVIKPLPDVLTFLNGSKVSTPEEWELRRAELKELLQRIEYGHMPGRPDALRAKRVATSNLTNGTVDRVILTIIPSNATPDITINFTVWVFKPNGPGPFPTVIKVAPDGMDSQKFFNETILARGYMYVCYNHIELDPDTCGYDVDGPCQQAYPDYDWGSLAVWAWGAMRVADYILGEPWVDSPDGTPPTNPDMLIITGHSRKGKTALLAGAMDERFTMVVPNGSGCGGAGSFLVQGARCETLASITSPFRYKSWFHVNFSEYAHQEHRLPFDQHFLRALVAPRVVLSTDGLGDFWANPLGTQVVYEATQRVYDFLNVSSKNGIHFRTGGHGFLPEDFQVLLDFADQQLLGLDRDVNTTVTPFKTDPAWFE